MYIFISRKIISWWYCCNYVCETSCYWLVCKIYLCPMFWQSMGCLLQALFRKKQIHSEQLENRFQILNGRLLRTFIQNCPIDGKSDFKFISDRPQYSWISYPAWRFALLFINIIGVRWYRAGHTNKQLLNLHISRLWMPEKLLIRDWASIVECLTHISKVDFRDTFNLLKKDKMLNERTKWTPREIVNLMQIGLETYFKTSNGTIPPKQM